MISNGLLCLIQIRTTVDTDTDVDLIAARVVSYMLTGGRVARVRTKADDASGKFVVAVPYN